MTEDIQDERPGQEPEDEWEGRSGSMLRTISSLLFYVALYYFIFRDLQSILLLVLVIIVHEGGHFLAMKAFGYTDIKLFFIPFFGALISGSHEHITPFRRSLMILAGPIPGIIIGLFCLFLGDGDIHSMIFRSGLLFTLLNLFNLLPLKPLDGGQLLFTAFPIQARWVQMLFMILMAIFLSWLCIIRHNYVYLVAPAFLLFGAFLRWRRARGQEASEPPSEGQQLLLLFIWLLGLLIPLASILFVPGLFPLRWSM